MCYVSSSQVKKLNGSGYAGVSIKPNTTSVSFIPRGEMDGEAKLNLLVNARPPNTTLMLG
jgi:hypothetical protein